MKLTDNEIIGMARNYADGHVARAGEMWPQVEFKGANLIAFVRRILETQAGGKSGGK